MIPLQRCKRCGAQAAGYMDIDFSCSQRRCPCRSLLNAKDQLAKVAYDGTEPRDSQREALRVMLDTMLFATEYADETEGMNPEQYEAWLEAWKKRGRS